MSELVRVMALVDDSGHWYVIPNDLYEKWREFETRVLTNRSDKDGVWEGEIWKEFDEVFGRYRTGGDLNAIQLFANI